MAKYLDATGLTQLWNKINDSFLSRGGGSMSSTGLVTNLNADLLDGQHSSSFASASHSHTFISSLGNYTPTTSDNRSGYGVYTYNIYGGTPQSYMSVCECEADANDDEC